MTREQCQNYRSHIINLAHSIVHSDYRNKIPSYASVSTQLNNEGLTTLRGNKWSEKRLFRFLQNAGYSGFLTGHFWPFTLHKVSSDGFRALNFQASSYIGLP
jgi:hypothetical protein